MTENVYTVLGKVQQELKAPKDKWNDFGKYHYRNCESILEGVKPLLKKYNASLRLTDEIVAVADRIYVKAIAYFRVGDEEIKNVAFAREDATKKGMDGAQITGAASSYARKYALNGLLLIDDTKDPDTDEYKNESDERAKREQAEDKESKHITKKEATIVEKMLTENQKAWVLQRYNIKDISEMNGYEYADLMNTLKARQNA